MEEDNLKQNEYWYCKHGVLFRVYQRHYEFGVATDIFDCDLQSEDKAKEHCLILNANLL